MELGIFEFMEKSVEYIEQKSFFIEYVSKQCKFYFKEILQDNTDVLSINARIKSKDSIKEKILKQNYCIKCKDVKDSFTLFPDLVGIRIECRFIENEKSIFEYLLDHFSVQCSKGYYKTEENDNIFLKLDDEQPQYQRNGFEIYKIDGIYLDASGDRLNFELQIKSMVNVFWGEIDHTILYKNFNYIITEDLVRDIMYSIRNNLSIIDMQLSTVYNKLLNLEQNKFDETKKQFKNIITKIIHDVYTLKIKYNLGIVIDIRGLSEFVTDYIFSKIDFSDRKSYEKEFAKLLNRVHSVANKKIFLSNIYDFSSLYFQDGLCKVFSEGLVNRINQDFSWNLAISIIMEVEDNNVQEEYEGIVLYIVNYIRKTVESETKEVHLNITDRNILNENISEKIIDYFYTDYYINYFTQESMGKLALVVRSFLKDQKTSKNLLNIEFENLYKELDYIYKGVKKGTDNEE